MDESTQNALRFAKILVDSGVNTSGNDKNTFHSELEKLAREEKLDGESVQQAYVRIATTTDHGRLLFKAVSLAPAPAPSVDPPIRKAAPEPAGEASAELAKMAREGAAKQGVSYERAFTKILTDPAHAELASRVRAEELKKSAAAF